MTELREDLVSKAVQGDRGALTALLERHGPLIWRGLDGEIPLRWRALLGREDVMQEVYLDAILSIKQLTGRTESAFAAWLAALARTTLLDSIRVLEADKRGGGCRRVAVESEAESFLCLYELLGSTSSTASRAAAREEAKVALEHALGQLSEIHQVAVRMYDLEGQSIGEVAKRLGRTEGAVFMLRARAHRRLREILGSASRFLSDSA
jgi:RNA polymerase sigma factor (sigma-70 family)